METIKKITNRLEGWGRVFYASMTSRVHAKRDAVIIGTLIVILAGLMVGDRYFPKKSLQDEAPADIQESEQPSEQEVYEEVEAIQKNVDTSGWASYRSQWYGFEIKYPRTWKSPVGQPRQNGSSWEYRYRFRDTGTEPRELYAGFDMVVYDIARVKELSGTDEFPKIQSEELRTDPRCQNIEGHLIETGDYPAEEIYLPPTDDCFNSALFFDFVQDRYIYVMVPVLRPGVVDVGDPRAAINEDFPEFFGVISTASAIEIVRPKAAVVPPKPKITAPKPVSYKHDDAGRLVCAKKRDRPSKSDKNKKRHLDMECCLDPDESPNPWCYYPPEKYGKYF